MSAGSHSLQDYTGTTGVLCPAVGSPEQERHGAASLSLAQGRWREWSISYEVQGFEIWDCSA